MTSPFENLSGPGKPLKAEPQQAVRKAVVCAVFLLPSAALARRRGGGGSHEWSDLVNSYVVWIIAALVTLVILLKGWNLLSRSRLERQRRVQAARQRGRKGG